MTIHPPPSPPQDVAIFRVESTGALKPEDIVTTAMELLARKLQNLKTALDQEEAEVEGTAPMGMPMM